METNNANSGGAVAIAAKPAALAAGAARRSLLSVAQAALERRILSGEFGMGGRVGEQMVADSLGVSRGPVREACRSLAARGLLEYVHNRGFFARRVDLADALEIYQLRMDLESAAAARFAVGANAAQLAKCRRLLEQMSRAAADGDFDSYYPLNLAFHEEIVRGGGNRRALAVHRDCLRDLHLFRARGLIAGNGIARSNREHKAIYRALGARDGKAAAAAVLAHIENGKNRMLKTLAANNFPFHHRGDHTHEQ